MEPEYMDCIVIHLDAFWLLRVKLKTWRLWSSASKVVTWMQLMTCQPENPRNNPWKIKWIPPFEGHNTETSGRDPKSILCANEIGCIFTSSTVVREKLRSIFSRASFHVPHFHKKKKLRPPFGRLLLLSHLYPVHRTTPPDHQSPWGPAASAIVWERTLWQNTHTQENILRQKSSLHNGQSSV